MGEPRILLATLCLNEMEWLPKLYEQHKDWPGLSTWVFVEGADRAYQRANPGMVDKYGLSTDGTTEWLMDLERADDRVLHRRVGLFPETKDPAMGKAWGRSKYCEEADLMRPDFLVHLDADEFYTRAHQHEVNRLCERATAAKNCWAICFRQREIWRPPPCAHLPLFSQEVVGGLWKMTHCHTWRWVRGMRYVKTHIWPESPSGLLLNHTMARYEHDPTAPVYVHLGWASSEKTREAKTAYYTARGEGQGDGRAKWMECRRAWREWRPGLRLPHGARVIPYSGPVPECFTKETA